MDHGLARPLLALAVTAALSACDGFEEMAATQLAAKPDARILALGDSVMWWNAEAGRAIADAVATALDEPVVNLAVPGAEFSHPDPDMAAEGLDIRAQYRTGGGVRGWEWVLLQGGANDLDGAAGPGDCAAVRDALIGAGGRAGEIPALVARIRADGARVVLLGYYALPAFAASDAFCGADLGTLSRRIALLAERDPGVVFVAMADVVDPRDPAAYDADAIHPSVRSSAAIGRQVAAAIAAARAR